MVRCGLIGFGAWGSHHARVIAANPHARLTAIAVLSEASRARARQEYPACQVGADYRELLERDDLDAIVVALPSHLHFEAARAVLESSRHLLLEKPMCLTTADCEALVAAARERKLVLAVGHEMRLSSLWGKARELIAAGALGEPLYALMELWRKPYRVGADGWRYDIDRVGNWILEEPIHFFDLARWYFQGTAGPTAVYARAGAKRADHPELQDNFSALVSFSGGRHAVISQSLGGWEHHQAVKMAGTEGALWASWSGATDRTLAPTFSLRVQRGSTLEVVPISRAAGEVFELEDQFARFLQAVQTGTSPAATGEDGCWSVRMCLKAQESVLIGAPVPL
ncbi:MAG TPA: Gfo/Idh/MocA family oxidoreductase [Gemmataceae bacterium]|jgi:myo-inositol 2-dehydrogenase/D-chiro-inositol 1-dehydrogenase|nr:Gfo/Idh/MocA family oxidoreductase [Gemmataceae bacterium]